MEKTKTELNIETLKAKGVVLSGTESPLELGRMVMQIGKGAKVENGKIVKEGDTPANSSSSGEKTQTGKYIVWLKGRAYINEKQRLDAGVYLMDEVPERISKQGASVVEVFEGEVPSKKVAQIGRWAGMNPDGIEDEVIMGKVLSRAIPF